MELWRLAVGVATWRYGNMDLRRALRTRDVEAWRYGMLEARCRRADVEVWSAGGALQALPLCLESSGGVLHA